ncbi:hypothetical protein ACOJQI_14890 [Bacillus salacetis]
MPTSKEALGENNALKECLYRHQKWHGRKMMSSKRVYAIIKRGTEGE